MRPTQNHQKRLASIKIISFQKRYHNLSVDLAYTFIMKIFVGSIRNTVTEQDLSEMFSNFGEVEAILYKGKYAFVFMPDDEQAKAACAALHQSEIKGCKINVENATPGKQGERFKSNPADFVRPPSDNPITKQSGKAPRFHHQFGRIKLIFGNIGSTTEEELCALVSPVAEIHETYILPGDKGVGFLQDELFKI